MYRQNNTNQINIPESTGNILRKNYVSNFCEGERLCGSIDQCQEESRNHMIVKTDEILSLHTYNVLPMVEVCQGNNLLCVFVNHEEAGL